MYTETYRTIEKVGGQHDAGQLKGDTHDWCLVFTHTLTPTGVYVPASTQTHPYMHPPKQHLHMHKHPHMCLRTHVCRASGLENQDCTFGVARVWMGPVYMVWC